jgi:hypothetical protein
VINVVWIDLTLATPDAMAGLWSAGVATFHPVDGATGPQPPIEVGAVAEPSPLQRLGAAMSSLSSGVSGAWPLAIAAGLAAILAAARSSGRRPWTGAWLASAAVLLTMGIIGIPRETIVPNSPPFALGTGSGVSVAARRIEPDGEATGGAAAEYISPPLALPAGARDVVLDWSTSAPKPAVAVASSSDGRHPAGWRDLPSTDGPLSIVLPGTNRYVHLRFRFDTQSGTLTRVSVRYHP